MTMVARRSGTGRATPKALSHQKIEMGMGTRKRVDIAERMGSAAKRKKLERRKRDEVEDEFPKAELMRSAGSS